MASTPTFGDDVRTAGNDTLDGLAGAIRSRSSS